MATITKFLIALLFFSLLVLQLAEADHDTVNSNLAASSPPTKIDCGSACEARCQLSSRPHLCKRACGTCCSRCSCVPPGTAGNYDACPCYASLTTHGGRRKCP
ncbi:gibberellin-regulated protein 1-like [Populus nigra]|uniref:gibberellin-regulated protein 1-like n=1 Tax=Populus nigra TaxID=3691 RepID=UPI002B26F576|nr:gibberellin-regulated protein 1-like [Populus nigra]